MNVLKFDEVLKMLSKFGTATNTQALKKPPNCYVTASYKCIRL